MALKYIGERTVGTLNGMKSSFAKDDLYRVYDAGILVPGGVSVDHGDFVSWDGTKWVNETDIRMAVTTDSSVGSLEQQSSNIAESFSASSTYAIGEVVIGPDGKLYQCTTAVETAGEWDPEDWDETSLGDILFTSRGSSNIEVRKSHCKVGDAVYADSDGNVHFIAGKSVVAADIPEGWEFVGVVALREGTKATILHKNENSGITFANCWLFKVTGLTFPLASSVSMVMQQGPTSGNTPVEVGTYTSSEGVTTLDDFVADLDDWLQDNPTASGALANYGWHAAKMKDAEGNDACFIIVDNINAQSRFLPVKSSTSGVTSPLHMWDFAGFTTDVTQIKRKDGVMTYAVLWNKKRFKAYNANVNNPTDSLTTTGIFNEDGFNATTTVKGYYGTYDNYLDHMVPDTGATTGAYAVFKGLGKQTADRLNAVKYTPLGGTEKSVFGAEAYAAEQKAHSTASVEGLNAGDWYIPGIDEEYEIFSAMNTDGSDPVNATFVAAGISAFSVAVSRWSPMRYSYYNAWRISGNASFYNDSFNYSFRASCVALLDLD